MNKRFDTKRVALKHHFIGQTDDHVLQHAGILVFQADDALLHAVLIVAGALVHPDAVRGDGDGIDTVPAGHGVAALLIQGDGLVHLPGHLHHQEGLGRLADGFAVSGFCRGFSHCRGCRRIRRQRTQSGVDLRLQHPRDNRHQGNQRNQSNYHDQILLIKMLLLHAKGSFYNKYLHYHTRIEPMRQVETPACTRGPPRASCARTPRLWTGGSSCFSMLYGTSARP